GSASFQTLEVSVANILDKIVATKRQEIRAAQDALSLPQLRARLQDAPPCRDFYAALAKEGPIRLIAEVKKASPSQGIIREDFDPVEIAEIYQENGAACISVLTDVQYFQGDLDYLSDIRQATSIPLLRKDFILDTYQLVEARVAGADAVLLIAECLDDSNLKLLHDEALELGLTPLVEFYRPENLTRVLEAGATLIGVNNRDLTTFETDLSHTVRMRDEVPESCLLVGESGIRGRNDVVYLEEAGVNAMLVGEHLMRQNDIGAAVREFLGTSKRLKSNPNTST
ncbi:MAG: indole-3-glycerol phosphate synthase TrpC, partial [Pirellulaceae bacterium]